MTHVYFTEINLIGSQVDIEVNHRHTHTHTHTHTKCMNMYPSLYLQSILTKAIYFHNKMKLSSSVATDKTVK